MAPFYKEPNPTNDPNYLGQSKEPDRVSYQGSGVAMGKLFEDIGQVAGKAFPAIEQGFKDSIKADAHSLIDPIQAEHGSYMDPEGVKEVAGTGAKGRVRALQMKNGADPFSDDTLGGNPGNDQFGTELFPPEAKPLPRQATQEISQLNRLTQAYNAGNLSDSYYDAQLVSVAKQLRAKYPGFRDEVDQAISQITGIQPANALRSSLVRDIQANQASMIASQNNDQKWIEKNAATINAVGLTREHPIQQLKAEVDRFEGKQKLLKSQQLEAEVGSPQAEAAMSDTVAAQVQSSIATMGNKAQGSAPYSEFVQRAKEMTLRGGGTPQEQTALLNQMELTKQQLQTTIRANLYKPIEGRKDGHSLVTLTKDGDQKVTTILNNQMKPWEDMIALVKSGNFSALETVTNMNKHQSQIDVQNLNRAFPQARVASAISAAFPNNPIMVNRFLETSDILPSWQKAVKDGVGNAILGGTAATPAPTPTEAVKAYGPNAAKGPAAKETLKQYDLVISKDNKNTPNAAHVAGQFFKDQDFYDSLNDSARMKTFMTMVSPEKTKYVQSLGDPALIDAHQKWVKYAAGDIFRRNSDDLNSLLSRKDVDVQFNPTTMQFEDRTPKTGQTYPTVQRQTQQNLQAINNAITLVRPVVGDDAGAVLSALGIDPTPKKEDGIVTRMFNALGDKLKNFRSDMDTEGTLEGSKKAPAPGKQSMNELPAAALRHVTAEAESGSDYNAVFGMGKSDKRDLSVHTVGEVMALQRHYTDSGSPSSAIGKYQFLRKTLDSLVKEGVVSRDEPFTPDVQERAFTALAKRRGLDKYMSGEMDEGSFMNSLAKEWAGLPTTNGMSFYAGDGLNKATTGPKKVLEALKRIRQEG
jgi:muramidase (phage lysozyme)